MKIRVTGLPAEVTDAVERLRQVLEVVSVSDPYPCRNSTRVHVYVEVSR
ncbi:hypothetical protein OG417_21325 [Actinoallomurus sp. NBC_01490]|nr:hypothetical protein [Actinoallomurus sp. NBC_01490]